MSFYNFHLIGNENDLNNLTFLNYFDINYIPLNNIPYSYFPASNFNDLINFSDKKYKNCNIKTINQTQTITLKFGGFYKINDEDENQLEAGNYKFDFDTTKGSIIFSLQKKQLYILKLQHLQF